MIDTPQITTDQIESAFNRWLTFCQVNHEKDEQDTQEAALNLSELLGLDEDTLRVTGDRLIDLLGHPAAGTAGLCGFFIGLLVADERDLAAIPLD